MNGDGGLASLTLIRRAGLPIRLAPQKKQPGMQASRLQHPRRRIRSEHPTAENRQPRDWHDADDLVREAEVLAPVRPCDRRRLRARLADASTAKHAADAMADVLAKTPWRWFATLTFRSCHSLEYAERAVGRWLDRESRHVWGRRYRNRPGQGLYGFVAYERQRRGDWHAHLLLAGTRRRSRFDAMRAWELATDTKDGGSFARIFPYDVERGAAGYCAKYLTKEATHRCWWDFCGAWTLPMQRFQRSVADAGASRSRDELENSSDAAWDQTRRINRHYRRLMRPRRVRRRIAD